MKKIISMLLVFCIIFSIAVTGVEPLVQTAEAATAVSGDYWTNAQVAAINAYLASSHVSGTIQSYQYTTVYAGRNYTTTAKNRQRILFYAGKLPLLWPRRSLLIGSSVFYRK